MLFVVYILFSTTLMLFAVRMINIVGLTYVYFVFSYLGAYSLLGSPLGATRLDREGEISKHPDPYVSFALLYQHFLCGFFTLRCEGSPRTRFLFI